MNAAQMKEKIQAGALDARLQAECAVSSEALSAAKNRCVAALDSAARLFGDDRPVFLFSVGGRTEVSGNHTDHNLGKVMAAAVNLDILAVASPRTDGVITVQSEGFPKDTVEPDAAAAPNPADRYTSRAVIAGMERAFLDRGYSVGGFDAYTTSDVLGGSGLSSSAAFEVAVGNILNHLYNDGRIENVEIAKMAQFAENVYFGKPCGLMDQTACAVGGFISIDFAQPDAPVIEKIDFDLSRTGYTLCIVSPGGSHADLNEDYAAVPAEMKSVAAALGASALRALSEDEVIRQAEKIRKSCGDRALLRALHFFQENRRVEEQTAALQRQDFAMFLRLVTESGRSSSQYLQNIYSPKNPTEQGLTLALCLTELFLRDKQAAWRVHGGGFAGTIQVFLPQEDAAVYVRSMEQVFGAGVCHMLSVRKAGAIRLL